ncbi:TIGR03032 family protein [Yoonia sp. 2307UL14-13]|uniref:TIGR03032 family protein n=1 Tax=Yoonia sp. 2307UL14-13 TaxID=3126506 RepID=UPI0030A0CA4F
MAESINHDGDQGQPDMQVAERRSDQIGFSYTPGFPKWLADQRVSLAFNTYHIGKLFMLGVNDLRQLQFRDATFTRAMGLSLHDGTLWMAGRNQLWRFENFLGKGQTSHGHDAVWVPMGATTTGLVNLHDVRASDKGVFFAACNFNCIGRLHEKWSFEPIWKPPFIPEFAFGDLCHLNCLALENGYPRYVTCFAKATPGRGWRSLPRDVSSGIVIDVQTDEIVCDGLHMPHSPQLHQGRLFVANSGMGEFGEVDLDAGRYRPICAVPGFTRGIAFWKHYALVGSSKPRRDGVFEGNDATPLNRRLKDTGEDPACQITIVDLKTEKPVHVLTIDGPASEIYDLCILPGIQRPLVLDFENELIDTTFRPSSFVL